jgi:hypothetical protein
VDETTVLAAYVSVIAIVAYVIGLGVGYFICLYINQHAIRVGRRTTEEGKK